MAGRQRGQSAAELASLFSLSKRSVERYWSRQQQAGMLSPKQRGGYRRSRLAAHDEHLRNWIAQQPDVTLEEIRTRLERELGVRPRRAVVWLRAGDFRAIFHPMMNISAVPHG